MTACKDCKYWVKTDIPQATHGDCHRYPPSSHHFEGASLKAVWKRTDPIDWCGEFQINQNIKKEPLDARFFKTERTEELHTKDKTPRKYNKKVKEYVTNSSL